MASKRNAALEAMIEDHLTVPFTTVLGVEVTVPKVDLPLPTSPPDGTAWIDAHRRWAGR